LDKPVKLLIFNANIFKLWDVVVADVIQKKTEFLQDVIIMALVALLMAVIN
jgi:hypothetical protein